MEIKWPFNQAINFGQINWNGKYTRRGYHLDFKISANGMKSALISVRFSLFAEDV